MKKTRDTKKTIVCPNSAKAIYLRYALDGGRDLVLDFAAQAITNALSMQRNIKDMRLQDFRRPNSALSYIPIRLSAFKL